MFKCEYCNQEHSAEEWNEHTARVLNCNIGSIDRIEGEYRGMAFYYCPSCNKEVLGQRFK